MNAKGSSKFAIAVLLGVLIAVSAAQEATPKYTQLPPTEIKDCPKKMSRSAVGSPFAFELKKSKKKCDVDYCEWFLCKHGKQCLRLIYGVRYSTSETPNVRVRHEWLAETSEYDSHFVAVMEQGKQQLVGVDTKGITRRGEHWRVFGTEDEVLDYKAADAELIAEYDRIVEQACFVRAAPVTD